LKPRRKAGKFTQPKMELCFERRNGDINGFEENTLSVLAESQLMRCSGTINDVLILKTSY
jgi:hypothetical protein